MGETEKRQDSKGIEVTTEEQITQNNKKILLNKDLSRIVFVSLRRGRDPIQEIALAF